MADKAYHFPHATESNKTVCGRPIEVNGRPQVLLTTDPDKKKAAVTPDGTMLVEGHKEPFNSPSRAGKAITGREVDGWTFWSYVKKDGNLEKLDTLRKEIAEPLKDCAGRHPGREVRHPP